MSTSRSRQLCALIGDERSAFRVSLAFSAASVARAPPTRPASTSVRNEMRPVSRSVLHDAGLAWVLNDIAVTSPAFNGMAQVGTTPYPYADEIV